MNESRPEDYGAVLRDRLDGRPVVLVGLMGAGKSSVGRRLAARLQLPFVDADSEIEKVSGRSVAELFELYGEAAFRDGERRVIQRLLGEGPSVLATGGGAFVDPRTRDEVKRRAVSLWLRARLEVLVERTARRDNRPLLRDGDPRAILEDLIDRRYPIYAEADTVIDSGHETPDITTERAFDALVRHLDIPPATETSTP